MSRPLKLELRCPEKCPRGSILKRQLQSQSKEHTEATIFPVALGRQSLSKKKA